jgi:hypothetical protein
MLELTNYNYGPPSDNGATIRTRSNWLVRYLRLKLWQFGLYNRCPDCGGELTGHGFVESFYYVTCRCGFRGELWSL